MTIEEDVDIRRKEAAAWFARLNQRKVTTADVKNFSEWRRDPENARAFTRIEEMWDAVGTLAKNPEMAALKREAAAPPVAPKRRRPGAGRLVPIGVAGALTAAFAVSGFVWLNLRSVDYATGVGEQRTVQLEDGSTIILDTASSVSVRYTGSRRLITLTSGQAMFEVESDRRRPFVVQAGDTAVTALGTRFDVRRSGAGARVTLAEGRVEVLRQAQTNGRWSLRPGQQVTTSIQRPTVASANVVAATSWTVGRLTFENTPIAEAVAEMNRYSRIPIELRSDKISPILVSGVFNSTDTEGFVAALCDLYALEADRTVAGRIVLSPTAKN
nr:FecR family protein [uncultured Brevundimonas sp.]